MTDQLESTLQNAAASMRSASKEIALMGSNLAGLRNQIHNVPRELVEVTRRRIPKLLLAMAQARMALVEAEQQAQHLVREASGRLRLDDSKQDGTPA